MKATTAVAVINTAMWLGITAAIIVALILTQRLSVFWFYLIPAFFGYATKQHGKEERE
jgi:hypothetical protein